MLAASIYVFAAYPMVLLGAVVLGGLLYFLRV